MRVLSKPNAVRLLLITGCLLGVHLVRPLVQVSAHSGSVPEGVRLPGIVRDFQSAHPDFGVSPLSIGHVAGNIAMDLDGNERPVLAGLGFAVDAQWYGRSGVPIAPHMYAVGPGNVVVPVSVPPVEINQAYSDTFNPEAGPYDWSNPGPAPHYMIGAEMPVIVEPTDLPDLQDRWRRNDNWETSSLSEDVHCERFEISNNHVVVVEGDVTVVCRSEFLMQNRGHIRLAEGASLKVYLMGSVTIKDQCSILMLPRDHTRIQFYNMGTEPMVIENQCMFYGTLESPNALVQVTDGSHFFGSFAGEGVFLENQVGFHIVGDAPSACGYAIADTYGTPGMDSDGTIQSSSTFNTWYRDAPGQNVAARHDITLLPVADGFLEFDAPTFYPVDGDLYGNEGGSHNRNFTYQVGAEFTFHGCQDQVIELQGSDDIWVYVDGRLVIDLGGIGANQVQVAALDRLELVDGEQYSFVVYFAHRSGSTPNFRLRTNLDIRRDDRVTRIPVFAGYD